MQIKFLIRGIFVKNIIKIYPKEGDVTFYRESSFNCGFRLCGMSYVYFAFI